MELSEKVKKGLSMCALPDGPINKCVLCPYGAVPGCDQAMETDALAYIRELEARLVEANKTSDDLRAKLAEYEKPLKPMTLEEVVEKSKRVNDNVIWLERPDEEYGYDDAECIPALVSNHSRIGADCIQYVRFLAWPKQEIFFDISCEDKDDYGKTWRCWPRRPTEAEREAAEWDD